MITIFLSILILSPLLMLASAAKRAWAFVVPRVVWATQESLIFIAAYLLLLSIGFWWGLLIVVMGPIQWPVTIAAIFYPKARGWAKNLWVGQDNAVNGLHGGNRDTDISGRVGFHAQRGSRIALHMERVINLGFFITIGQRDHCRASIERDEKYHRHMGY